jgi:predicted Abi (CAAX) family protease
LSGTDARADRVTPRKLGNYERYRQADFNRPEFYPLDRSISPTNYQPISPWMGRLILPDRERRQAIAGVLFEVHHAPSDLQHLVGQIVILRLCDEPEVRSNLKDVHFSAKAEHSSQQGNVHPTRINRWRQVNPLESLAGSHPHDDVIVMLQDPVSVRSAEHTSTSVILYIAREPVQITGRYYGLVKFVRPIQLESDLFRVVHYNLASRQFDGAQETVRLPQVVANSNQTCPSTNRNIAASPLNKTGWYIYGAPDRAGQFTVQAIAPRALLQVEPERKVVGKKAVKQYLKKAVWSNLTAQKGKISSTLLSTKTIQLESTDTWREGQRALLIHVYGGIGGDRAEPKAKSPLYFGHFAYGIAKVVREPLADELRFEIVYHQIYTHNSDGLIAGSLHWSRYIGDRLRYS